MLMGFGLFLFFGAFAAFLLLTYIGISAEVTVLVGSVMWVAGFAMLMTADNINFQKYEKHCLGNGGFVAEYTSLDGWKCWTKDGRQIFLKTGD